MTERRKGRPRSNISILSRETRERIAYLLDDGKTYVEIRNDEKISQEVQKNGGKRLHSTSFIKFRESEEYEEFLRIRHDKDSYLKKQLLDISNSLSSSEKVRLLTIVVANFPDKIKEETKKQNNNQGVNR